MQFSSYNDLPRRTFEERVSGDETVEKSRAGQMVLAICGRYDTACFYLFFFRKFKCGGDLDKPVGTSLPLIRSFPFKDLALLIH